LRAAAIKGGSHRHCNRSHRFVGAATQSRSKAP